jgi:hypothetical protein
MEKPVKKNTRNTKSGKTGEKIPQRKGGKGKTPSEIMSRHIQDEKAVITDEEFKNLETGADVTDDSKHEPLDLPEDHNRPKDEDKDPRIVTPWDVIN